MEETLTIDVEKILESEIGSSDVVKINFLPVSSGKDFELNGAIKGNIYITKLDKSFEAKFDLKTHVIQQCSRCQKVFFVVIEIKTERVYDEINDKVDVWPAIREEIIVSLPMKPLCKEKCPGIKY